MLYAMKKMDQSLYRFENESVEPFNYVGYEFCITGLIKLENNFYFYLELGFVKQQV